MSEQVSAAGSSALQAAKDLDSKYEVSATISSAFSFGAASLSSYLSGGSKPAEGKGGSDSQLDDTDVL